MRVVAGIFTFLFGMNLMARSLEALEHTALKRWITIISRRPWLGFVTAAFFAFLIQSSSTVSVIIIGLIAGQMITLPQAFVLLLGSNIGTTVQVPFLREIVQGVFVLAGLIAFFIWLISNRTDHKNVALSFVGTALVFTGLHAVINGLSGLTESLWLTESLRTLASGMPAFFHGLTVTALLQSSGISLGVAGSFLQTGLLTLAPALFFMMGANVGTTSTGMISTIGAEIDPKRTAVLHVLINLFGTILFWPVFWILLRTGFLENLPWTPERVLMGSHFVFNLASALVLLPMTGVFVRLVRFLVPEPMQPRAQEAVPSLAEETSVLVLRTRFQALFRTMWAYTKQVFDLFQTMDAGQIERSTQIRENIEQTRIRLRAEFFAMARHVSADEAPQDSDFMRLIGVMEDMEILYGLAHDVFLLATDRIMHQRKVDPASTAALRRHFKKTLDLVYLCAQLEDRDPQEVGMAMHNQAEFDQNRRVFLRNVWLSVREGVIDEKSAEDLLTVHRLLERMNLAGRILLERDETA